MNRSLLVLLAVGSTAFTASAYAQSAVLGGASKPRPVPHSDPLGPRLPGSGTVAESVARADIEKGGYTGVRGLVRTSSGGWQAVAMNRTNAPVVVAVDSHRQVSEIR